MNPQEIKWDTVFQNLILWIPPVMAYFMGIILKYVYNKSLDKPAPKLITQLIYGIFTGAGAIYASMSVLSASIMTDFNVFIYNLAVLAGVGATVSDKLVEKLSGVKVESKHE